mmetsp:Transcript_32815/g.57225  ORF Transcript_32815/g.57225 Transcript_32815/m.57225 type:complete len:247 (+) Transcript_32815:6984-7724(+)
MQLEELGLKAKRSMYSRVGILSEKSSPFTHRIKSDSRSFRLPSLYDEIRPVTPIAERINKAVKEAEASVIEAKRKAQQELRPELSCSFTTVSREHLDSLRKSDSPTPTQYNPRFQYLMRSSPKVKIIKAKSSLLKPLPEVRSRSVEHKSPTPSMASIDATDAKMRGISFDKQLPRRSLVNKFEGADSVYLVNESTVNTKNTHDFSHYVKRRELFDLNRPMPDYEPKYNFVSKPRPSVFFKESYFDL